MRAARLSLVVLLFACSGAGLSCEEFSSAATQIMSDMTVESSAAEALIRKGAERDFDEQASAELAAGFENLSSAVDRLAEFDALGPAPDEWLEGAARLREAVFLQETAVDELASAFAEQDAASLGEAATKMAGALDLVTDIGDRLPDC